MSRTVRDSRLETRAARARLEPRKKSYWKTLVPGSLHLGYRRKKKDEPGVWLARRYLGGERYRVAPLGLADDFRDGVGLTFEAAQRAAYEYREEQERQVKGKPSSLITVRDAIEDYVAWLRVHRATANDAERRATKLILPPLGALKIADLTSRQISNWLNRLAERPALARTARGEAQNFKPAPATDDERRGRRATANRTLTILKAALNRAWREGHTADATAWQRVKPFGKADAARPGHLSIEEASRLINAADPTTGFRDLVKAALLTGCRYGELIALSVRDYRSAKLHVARSKSGKRRDVVLTTEGAAFFEALTLGRAGDEPLLLRDGVAWTPSAQARPMRAACEAARIVPAVGIHQLRHTYASLAVMAGMPLAVLARNLGHSSTAMIEKHYGHLTQSYVDDAIRRHAPTFGLETKTNVARLAR